MTKNLEPIARAICKSGKFETGQGTCAAICMEQLGDARRQCSHAARVHGKLAERIYDAALAWQPLATAPRDGTFVELRGPSGYGVHPHRVMLARYERDREYEPAVATYNCPKDEHCWRTVAGDRCTDDGDMPTEWRPTT